MMHSTPWMSKQKANSFFQTKKLSINKHSGGPVIVLLQRFLLTLMKPVYYRHISHFIISMYILP